MWLVAVVLAGALAVVWGVVLRLRRTYAACPLGWRVLAHAGWPLVLAGAIFAARFWTPTPGPYVANVRYPFGTHLAAWAVSFGFTWIAFGLLFTALAVLARDAQRPLAWWALLAAWALCWLPHGYIGLATALGGMAPASVSSYQRWGSSTGGALLLAADAALLAAHFALSAAGFALTGRALRRRRAGPIAQAA
jgi:hypothetical protein